MYAASGRLGLFYRQNVHRTVPDARAAGCALACVFAVRRLAYDLFRTSIRALHAADAELPVYLVYSVAVDDDCRNGTCLRAFPALSTVTEKAFSVFARLHPDAGQIGTPVCAVEKQCAGILTGSALNTAYGIVHYQFFHGNRS